MLIDDLQVQAPQMMHQPVDPALAAQVTVLAFRDVQAPGPVLPLRP